MRLQAEQIDHIKVVNWFDYHYPELAEDFHHFANERKCSPQQGMILKKMGVRKGVLDFHLAAARGGQFGLWLELKVGSGRLSPEQKTFIERKNAQGYLAVAAWGFEACKAIIVTYLNSGITNCIQNEPKNLCNGKPIC